MRQITHMLLAGPAMAVALFAASPSAAQAFNDWRSGPWSVVSDGSDCLLIHRENDRQFAIAIGNKDDDFYVEIKTPGTRARTRETKVPVSVAFAGQNYGAVGMSMPDGALGTIIQGSSREFTKLFERADRVSFAVESGETVEFRMDTTARQQFYKCVSSIGGVASAIAR